MAQVLIRNLDEQLVAQLKEKAEKAGLSLEAYLRNTLAGEVAPSRAEVWAEIEALRKTVRPPSGGEPLSDEVLREQREDRALEQAKLHGLLNDR